VVAEVVPLDVNVLGKVVPVDVVDL